MPCLDVGVQQCDFGGKGFEIQSLIIAAVPHACIHQLRDLQQLQDHWMLLCMTHIVPLRRGIYLQSAPLQQPLLISAPLFTDRDSTDAAPCKIVHLVGCADGLAHAIVMTDVRGAM